jgi:hypothetical protein
MAAGEVRVLGARRRDLVILIVQRDCVIDHEGRTYDEGEVLRTTLDEASRLEAQGLVLRAE